MADGARLISAAAVGLTLRRVATRRRDRGALPSSFVAKLASGYLVESRYECRPGEQICAACAPGGGSRIRCLSSAATGRRGMAASVGAVAPVGQGPVRRRESLDAPARRHTLTRQERTGEEGAGGASRSSATRPRIAAGAPARTLPSGERSGKRAGRGAVVPVGARRRGGRRGGSPLRRRRPAMR